MFNSFESFRDGVGEEKQENKKPTSDSFCSHDFCSSKSSENYS